MTSESTKPDLARLIALVPAGHPEIIDPLAAVRAARGLAEAAGAVDAAPVIALVADPGGDVARTAASAYAAGADEVWALQHAASGEGICTDLYVRVFAAVMPQVGLGRGAGTLSGEPERVHDRAEDCASAQGHDAAAARTLVLVPAGGGEELAARLAARVCGIPLGRCTAIAFDDVAGLLVTRSAFGGRAEVQTHSARGPWFAAVRARKGEPTSSARAVSTPHVLSFAVEQAVGPLISRTDAAAAPRKAALEGARIVVSGGRGLGGQAGFELLQEVADAVGGALGGSLPTVDSGWLPVARQVGQSGTYVTPEIYFAVAISGTPQHLAGIGPDTRIVAVNNDPDAEIFKVAEVGVVADWKQLMPALINALQTQRPDPSEV